MFCDLTQITVKAGNGGNGCISTHREKFVAKGGPNGGNGGKGGSILIRGNENLNTLIELHTKRFFYAENGEQGKGSECHGKYGEDLILEVPIGTLIKNQNTGEIIADITAHNELVEIIQGGRGGYGNQHFKSSTRQCPMFAELGEPGEEIPLVLELQLVADMGIIGLPSAGKSTFISVISSARPKIAEYHFTTLVPNLGVVRMSESRSFVACDVPGLIEGASDGKGLGDEFLRHITRSRIMLHLVDINEEKRIENYKIIRKELESYSPELAEKKEIVAFSKCDIAGGDDELLSLLQDEFEKETGIRPFLLSSSSQGGVEELLEHVWFCLQEEKKSSGSFPEKEEIEEEERIIFRPHVDNVDPKHWTIESEIQKGDAYGSPRREGFRIKGKRFEQIVVMTNFDNKEAVIRVRDVMFKMGIQQELIKRGVIAGTPLFVGDKYYPFEPLKLR